MKILEKMKQTDINIILQFQDRFPYFWRYFRFKLN